MKLIKIEGSRKYGMVDDADYEKVVSHNWSLNDSGYPRAALKGGIVYLHRMIIDDGEHDHLEVDHKDRVKIDCRRSNLRFCTHQQNTWNTKRKQRHDTVSQYQGVGYCYESRTWTARVTKSGEMVHHTNHDTEIEAARYYNNAAKKHFGEFAYQNEI